MTGVAARRREPIGRPAEVASGGALLRALGMRIRELRKARRMTLAALARRTGMSVSYVSQVERSLSSPSVVALYEISRALGVNISFFFADGHTGPDSERDFVVRAARRRKVAFEAGAVDELLSPNLDGRLELLLSRLPPGSMSGAQPYTHDGEEGGLVLAGRLELWIGDKHFMLSQGDSFTFASNLPHRYGNPGKAETVVVWAITPPSY
ncbi:MAG: helix-turn-helix domain-containing protein [Dongiaceae bacterium]